MIVNQNLIQDLRESAQENILLVLGDDSGVYREFHFLDAAIDSIGYLSEEEFKALVVSLLPYCKDLILTKD